MGSVGNFKNSSATSIFYLMYVPGFALMIPYSLKGRVQFMYNLWVYHASWMKGKISSEPKRTGCTYSTTSLHMVIYCFCLLEYLLKSKSIGCLHLGQYSPSCREPLWDGNDIQANQGGRCHVWVAVNWN